MDQMGWPTTAMIDGVKREYLVRNLPEKVCRCYEEDFCLKVLHHYVSSVRVSTLKDTAIFRNLIVSNFSYLNLESS